MNEKGIPIFRGDRSMEESIQQQLLAHTKDARGLIFDLDGTLADTMPLHDTAWKQTFAEFNLAPTPVELVAHHGRSPTDYINELLVNNSWDINPELFVERRHQRYEEMLGQIKPINPVVNVALAKLGVIPMAVASGGPWKHVSATLTGLGIRNLFSAVVTSDDAVAAKPSPAIFLEAARRLEVEAKHCVVFEDADSGIEGAKAAGMYVVDVRPYLLGMSI